MDVLEAAGKGRDWLVLPTGVLQLIICFASTWQTPGPCLASLVCRTWRSAAAGCRGIRLLFHAGHYIVDQGFCAWLAGNGLVLGAFTLSSSKLSGTTMVLEALADAAAAAQAAGRPLRLHTLRILQGRLTSQTAGRLVAALPYLRCLQLSMNGPWVVEEEGCDELLGNLAPLQQATQLQELYLEGPDAFMGIDADVALLLPLSLKRFSWMPEGMLSSGSLSHLTQLTFLRLVGNPFGALSSSLLPSSLQQLELMDRDICLEVVEQQRQVVTAWLIDDLQDEVTQKLLARLPKLKAVEVSVNELTTDAGRAAVQQLTHLSALTLANVAMGFEMEQFTAQALLAAAGISSLRRLRLLLWDKPAPIGVSILQQLTQFRLVMLGDEGTAEEQRACGEAVGRLAGLQWLSVPAVLVTAGHAWLGGLQQLRVLVVQCNPAGVEDVSSMSWLESVPPRLKVLGVGGVTAEEAATRQLRRRLQQALGSRGCEVVVGVDLDAAADPTQQLAGLPQGLQQALA
jgi:hypothetical protein